MRDDDEGSVRQVSAALRLVVLAMERYRHSLAEQLAVGTSEVITLGYLHHEGALTPRDIAEHLGLTSGSVTALLDRLESSGYVNRQQHPDDRRSLLVTATPAGRHAMQWVYEQFDAAVEAALSETPSIDQASLTGFLKAASVTMLAQASTPER